MNGGRIANRKAKNNLLRLFLLFLLVLTGCRLPVVTEPVPSATITPVAPATNTPSRGPILPMTPQAGEGLSSAPPSWPLETLSEGNAARMGLLTQVGEGRFGDAIQASPDGRLLAVTTAGGVLLVDAASGQRLDFYPSSNPVDSLAFAPDGKTLATVHREPGAELMATGDTAGMPIYHPILTVRDLASDEVILSLNLSGRGCGQYAAWDLAYSPDGQTLLFRDYYSWLGHDRTNNLCLLSAIDGALIRAIHIELPWDDSLAWFSPDGQKIWVLLSDFHSDNPAGLPTRVRAYETASGSLAGEFDGQGSFYDAALSPDGDWLALAGDRNARLLSIRDGGRQAGSLLAEFGDHSREVIATAFSPDGATLALGSLDGTVSLWAVPEGRFLWQTQPWVPALPYGEGEEVGIWDLAFSLDGQVLFALELAPVSNTSTRVSALQVSNGQALFSVYGYNEYSRPGLSPDASLLVFGGYEDGRAQVWSVAENEPVIEIQGHAGMVLAARFSPDGQQIATAALDGSVRLWQAADGSPAATLEGHTGPVRTIQYSPDGRQLVSVGDDATLQLWDPDAGQLIKSIPTQTGEGLAHSIAFSPDGQSALLATGCPYANCPGGGQGDLRQVDLQSGQITTLFAQPVYSVSFSADLLAFATYSPQGIQTGQVIEGQYLPRVTYTSPIGKGALEGTAISPDGVLFFSGNGFGLHVWNAASGEMLALCQGGTSFYGDMWVTPDQRMVVIASWNGLVFFWGVPRDQ